MGLTGKNVLVTGGTGFIGSHLVKRLINDKANVIVPYQSLNPKSYFLRQRLARYVILVQKDLKNFKRTLDIVTKYEIDFIFHLAAQSIVPTAYYNPLETFETNIIGTANVLEAARLYGKVQGIIVVSSDKAYGKIPKASEKDPLSGDHPYETSKAACDLITTTYFKTYNLPTVVVRFGNVYGEGDINFSRIIPGALKAIVKRDVLDVRSDGKYIRDYVYVKDIVEALIVCSKNIQKIKGEVFNVSSRENLSVLALLGKIEKKLGRKIKYRITKSAINEIPQQSINFNKIRKMLAWKPASNIDKTIKDIYEWYKEYFQEVKSSS
ncbi:hypothetical protein A3D81_01245 [Candidatus Curtissbacteria bacterium RIFCSPHIGHO2_02_FULL_40_17]|uniref:NAD(P)-binding domain-containing protein n=3 Tax=Candidatus Curtissiibacteriota TaxID=1752717 RepID=A0A1F5GHX7_9BACT|nr:MAG: hypothetical protein A3D81_01245 [Candidatus Curtissbacteria bacterium RIFCSPHIGHO2_02_FULL_40_17]OGE04063.1 MAG: hypothetical protein A3F45_02930 [Candidatus Curtissbacteria bacterium RIFCSPHIGHO2_12_FULL_41_17]OGE08616.1 MAG: hypothetical protein A3I53_02500 [Candidatus Curtissbacteria bacterium RIFCSPLOWO2_02_FULL_40_13b]